MQANATPGATIDAPSKDSRRKAPEIQLLEASQLLDAYGGLLTERQRNCMRLHFEQDFSFSEIARENGISRQAVHDAVRHAVETLKDLESHLHLVRQANIERGKPPADAQLGGRQLIQRLKNLRKRIAESKVPAPPRWIGQELDSLIQLLEGKQK